MVYLRRGFITLFSAGWVVELLGSISGVLGYIVLPPTGIVNSFPVVDFMRDGFTRGVVWLALVVLYWTWRYGGRLWGVIAALSGAGLAPTIVFGQEFFLRVSAVYGNGMVPLTPVVNGGAVVAQAGSRVVVAFACWLVAMLAFWAWRLSAEIRPRAESA